MAKAIAFIIIGFVFGAFFGMTFVSMGLILSIKIWGFAIVITLLVIIADILIKFY